MLVVILVRVLDRDDQPPGQTPLPSARVEQIFLEIVQKPAAEQEQALNALCGDDAALRHEVASLLGHHQDSGDRFLNPAGVRPLTAFGLEGLGRAFDEPELKPGTRVQDYTIERLIGAGGMGMVYRAEQSNPRRTVAIKIIRRGLGTAGLTRRFQHEAEILGRLQHPGIAQVFEAGSVKLEGVPRSFIAMEFIRGLDLAQHVERQTLDTRARLSLISRVADAVHHAHQRGVIHRDLKPANILVDEAGQPKILDFGVARASDADLQVTTMNTGIGQLIGTLPYMSPEQVLADPREVDLRSDVYALGVVLYQLLTGKLPHDLSSRSIPDAARIIRDERPARLSAVSRVFRGEIETIVSTAMEKDKNRRYQTAAALRDDIDRHLRGDPIAARDDSALYLLRKQLRRYRGMLVAGSISLVVVSVLSVIALVNASRARQAAWDERQARTQADIATSGAVTAREELASQLSVSQVTAARGLSHAGSTPVASDVLWREHLSGTHPEDTHWALWDLYSENPLLHSISLGEQRAYGLAVVPATDSELACLLTGDSEGNVTLRSMDDFRVLAQLGRSAGIVTSVSVSLARPSGHGPRLAATASTGGDVQLWDLTARGPLGAPLRSNPDEPQRGASFSADGRYVCAATSPGQVRIWEVATRELVRELPQKNCWSSAFSPDGRWLSTISGREIYVWSLHDGLPVRESEPLVLRGHRDLATAMAYSPDGNRLFTGARDKEFRIWRLPDGSNIGVVRAPIGSIRALHVTADDQYLFVGGYWAAQRWFIGGASPQPRGWVPMPTFVESVMMCPDGFRVVCASNGLRVVDFSRRLGEVQPARRHRYRTRVSFGRDLRVLATVDEDGFIRIFESTDCRLLAAIRLGEPTETDGVKFWAPKFHPTQPLLACANDAGMLAIVDLRDGSITRHETGTVGQTNSPIDFSPDGSMIALVTGEDSFSVRNFPSMTAREGFDRIESSTEAIAVQFLSDTRLATAARREVRLWDLAEGTANVIPFGDGEIWHPDFSPDGLRMCTGSWTGQVRVQEIPSGRAQVEFVGHQGLASEARFRPGNEWMIASGGVDGRVTLWDTRTGRMLHTFDAMRGWDIQALSFSPDGRQLASSSGDGDVRVWDLEYFDRHIAGNLEYNIERAAKRGWDANETDRLRIWAAEVMSRPWPRSGEHAVTVFEKGPGPSGIDPGVIETWGAATLDSAWPHAPK